MAAGAAVAATPVAAAAGATFVILGFGSDMCSSNSRWITVPKASTGLRDFCKRRRGQVNCFHGKPMLEWKRANLMPGANYVFCLANDNKRVVILQ